MSFHGETSSPLVEASFPWFSAAGRAGGKQASRLLNTREKRSLLGGKETSGSAAKCRLFSEELKFIESGHAGLIRGRLLLVFN